MLDIWGSKAWQTARTAVVSGRYRPDPDAAMGHSSRRARAGGDQPVRLNGPHRTGPTRFRAVRSWPPQGGPTARPVPSRSACESTKRVARCTRATRLVVRPWQTRTGERRAAALQPGAGGGPETGQAPGFRSRQARRATASTAVAVKVAASASGPMRRPSRHPSERSRDLTGSRRMRRRRAPATGRPVPRCAPALRQSGRCRRRAGSP